MIAAMHVLIATTGALSPQPAVDFTAALLGEDGKVTITTVIEVPRPFLDEVAGEDWHPLTGEVSHERSPDDHIRAYVEERGRRLTEPIVAALQGIGVRPQTHFLEGADPAAEISDLAEHIGADVVILGATRQIFDQSAWESVSARIMIESGKPVLVVPPPTRTDADHNDAHGVPEAAPLS